MTVQKRNHDLVDLLSGDFCRNNAREDLRIYRVSVNTTNTTWKVEAEDNVTLGDGTTWNLARFDLNITTSEDCSACDWEGLYSRIDLTLDHDVDTSYIAALHGDLFIHGTGDAGPQINAGVYGTVSVDTDYSTGTIDTAMGVRGEVTIEDGVNMKLAALYAAWPEINDGTIAHNAGVHIDDVTADTDYAGTAGADWQIYSAGDVPSYFAGNVSIGDQTAITWRLNVDDSIAPATGNTVNLVWCNLDVPAAAALNANDIEGIFCTVDYDNSTGAFTNGYLIGVRGDLDLGGSQSIGPMPIAALWGTATYNGTAGTVVTMAGVRGDITVTAASSIANFRTATFFAGEPSITPTTTVHYGLYMEDQASNAAANYGIFIDGTTVPSYIAGGLGVGNGATSALATAQVEIMQADNSAAIACVMWDQSDVDEAYVYLVGDAAAATITRDLVSAADVSSSTLRGYYKIYILDDGNQIADGYKYVPFYTLT